MRTKKSDSRRKRQIKGEKCQIWGRIAQIKAGKKISWKPPQKARKKEIKHRKSKLKVETSRLSAAIPKLNVGNSK